MTNDWVKNNAACAREQPVERHQEDQDERGVVADQVATHQRHERCVEPAHQPDTLVVQPEVVRRRPETVVHVEA